MTHGILLLDKPEGLSSNAALQRVRRAFGRVKAGHTGSLDPLATGMLPICLGEATKVAGYLLDGDKEYLFTARFGERTSTGDREGEVVETAPVPDDLAAAVAAAIPSLQGPILQVPPMYSALKRDGQPLYRLARQGVEVEREARPVTIHELAHCEAQGRDVRMRVRCSKGTYVRTLAEDLARAAGSVAHLIMLRRTAVAPFPPNGLISLEALEADPAAARLLPSDAALPQLAAVELDADAARCLAMGQAVAAAAGPGGQALLRVYGPGGRFLGICRPGTGADDAGKIQPVRLFNETSANPT